MSYIKRAINEMIFNVGDRVIKNDGDYTFEGEIIAVFRKRSGVVRYAVEDNRGIILIMRDAQLKRS